MLNRLDAAQKKEFTNLVKNGASPADLATHFQLGIATVHNYKNELKAEGVVIPNVRGKRPSGIIDRGGAGFLGSSKTRHSKPHDVTASHTNGSGEDLHITVNGVFVTIGGKAKSVHIDKSHIEVDF